MNEKIVKYLLKPIIAGFIVVLVVFGANLILDLFGISPFRITYTTSVSTVIGAVVFLWVDGAIIWVLWSEKVIDNLLLK